MHNILCVFFKFAGVKQMRIMRGKIMIHALQLNLSCAKKKQGEKNQVKYQHGISLTSLIR